MDIKLKLLSKDMQKTHISSINTFNFTITFSSFKHFLSDQFLPVLFINVFLPDINSYVIRFLEYKKEITSKYSVNYKIIPITYWDEIPSKNKNFKSFNAEQFFLGNLFSIFYSNPRAPRAFR